MSRRGFDFDYEDGRPVFNRFGEGEDDTNLTSRRRPPDERKERIESLQHSASDRALALACTRAGPRDTKIQSICDWHWQGKKLSDKQKWCLAEFCIDHELEVTEYGEGEG